jgi:SAM-dependent methyltransferase
MAVNGTYIQYGAGPSSCPEGWLNFDASPTLRLQRLPLIGPLIVPASQRFPADARHGDIVAGLPVAPGSADGIYASHVLEHLALADARRAMRNTLAMLKPGGVFRCIVPDLAERARRYLAEVAKGDPLASQHFLEGSYLGREARARGLVGRLREVLGGSAHLWMWDELSFRKELEDAGFVDIRRCAFGDAGDPMFARVEDRGRFVDQGFAPAMVELAFEARRPG